MPDHARMLPKLSIMGTEYFVDERLQELREVDNPHNIMRFSVFEAAMSAATIHARYSQPRDPEALLELFTHAMAYDQARGRQPSEAVCQIVTELQNELTARHVKRRARRERERVH